MILKIFSYPGDFKILWDQTSMVRQAAFLQNCCNFSSISKKAKEVVLNGTVVFRRFSKWQDGAKGYSRCKKILTALSDRIKSLYISFVSVPACWDLNKMSTAIQAAYWPVQTHSIEWIKSSVSQDQ